MRKKILLSILFVISLFFGGIMLTACAKDKVVEIKSIEGFENSIVLNGEYDYSNAKIIVELESGKTLEVASKDLTVEGLDTSVAGTQTITISYTKDGKTVNCELEVEVYEDVATRIVSASGLSSSVKYGEQYATANATVTVEYRSGKTETINAEDLSFSEIDTSVIGPQNLVITYATLTYQMEVIVYNVDQVSAIVAVEGLENSVKVGATYNTSNAVATIIRTTGVTYTVTADDLEFSEIDTSEAGEKTLVITYSQNGVTLTRDFIVVVYENLVVNAKIVENSYDKTINLGDEFDTQGIILKLTYQSGETASIYADELEITAVDTLVLGDQEFTVSYKIGETTYSDKATVTINKNYTIMGYDDPLFVASYRRNSQLNNTYTATGADGNKGFAITGNPYLVGDDNEFKYAPSMSVMYSETLETGKLDAYKAVYTLYVLEEDEYVLLEDENIAKYVLIDEEAHTLKFTNKAQGKTFKVSVLPKYITDAEAENISASQFEFNVVDGYNVYNTADLSVFDNVNYDGKWTAYKTENNIDLDLQVSSLILQNDITIERDDIPSVHYWKESEVAGATDYSRVLNSLKDSTNDLLGFIYRRDIKDGSTFKFEGNYFQISAQNLPLIVRERNKSTSLEGEAITVHTALFGFFGDETGSKITSYELNNISLYGNTKKTETTTLSGGVIFMKKDNCSFTAYNNLSQGWFIEYFNEEGDMNGVYAVDPTRIALNLKAVNAFDAYNSIIYNWGGVLNIEDSIMIGAGGPVMICDHVGNNKTTGEGGVISTVNTKNSILESWITGGEGWFVSFNATELAGQIKAINYLTSPYGVKITDSANEKINLIAVYKSSELQDITSSKIRGTFKDDKYENGLDLTKKAINDYMDIAVAANVVSSQQRAQLDAAAPILQAYNGAFGYIGETNWLISPTQTQALTSADFSQADDYVNIYLPNNMAVVLGASNTNNA